MTAKQDGGGNAANTEKQKLLKIPEAQSQQEQTPMAVNYTDANWKESMGSAAVR